MRHSKEDAKWIKEQLERLPFRYRRQAQEGYSAAYERAYDEEPADHRKENRARFAANTRLRKFIEKALALE